MAQLFAQGAGQLDADVPRRDVLRLNDPVRQGEASKAAFWRELQMANWLRR